MLGAVAGARALGRRTVLLRALGALPSRYAHTCRTLALLLAAHAVDAAATDSVVDHAPEADLFRFGGRRGCLRSLEVVEL